jgi:hypothetical protein
MNKTEELLSLKRIWTEYGPCRVIWHLDDGLEFYLIGRSKNTNDNLNKTFIIEQICKDRSQYLPMDSTLKNWRPHPDSIPKTTWTISNPYKIKSKVDMLVLSIDILEQLIYDMTENELIQELEILTEHYKNIESKSFDTVMNMIGYFKQKKKKD